MFRVLLLAALFYHFHNSIFCNAQYERKTRGYDLLKQITNGQNYNNNVRYMISQGVDEVHDSDGNSALHLAAQFFNLYAFTALLDADFNPTHKNAYSETPFDLLINVEFEKYQDDPRAASSIIQRQLTMVQGILKHAWTKGIAAYKDILKHFVWEKQLDDFVEQSIYNIAMTTRSVEILLHSNPSYS